MEENLRNPICCICGKECEDKWGNDPWPVNNDTGTRCCNKCNNDVVISTRRKIREEMIRTDYIKPKN